MNPSHVRRSAVAAAAPWLLWLMPTACFLAPADRPQLNDAPDPNPIYGGAPENERVPLQQKARTTLLEENEHLRDLLSEALAEKRSWQQRAQEAEEKAKKAEAALQERDDSLAALSEQIQALQARLEEAEARAEKADRERRAIASMYALEHRQRLALEKDLLEREIAERTRKEHP